MKTVHVRVGFPDTAEELLEHPESVVLVIPLTVPETAHMGAAVNAVGDQVAFNARAFKEMTEGKRDGEKYIRDLLDQMVEPSIAADEIFEGLRLLLARAVLVKRFKDKPATGKGPIQ